jgi:hypothetical protein
MPTGIAPKGFYGKKGRSGRLSAADERLKNRVKHRAWLMKEAKMDDKEAIQIVLKDMTVKTDIMSGGKRIGGVDLFNYLQWRDDQNNNSNQENKGIDQENTDNTGRDISEQDL